jgi:hypothetical protein
MESLVVFNRNRWSPSPGARILGPQHSREARNDAAGKKNWRIFLHGIAFHHIADFGDETRTRVFVSLKKLARRRDEATWGSSPGGARFYPRSRGRVSPFPHPICFGNPQPPSRKVLRNTPSDRNRCFGVRLASASIISHPGVNRNDLAVVFAVFIRFSILVASASIVMIAFVLLETFGAI